MQDMVGGDYIRTPAIFRVPNIFVFVGTICIKLSGVENSSGIVIRHFDGFFEIHPQFFEQID
ncbi:MAG: hypothetical protein MUP09_02755 [Thiovulaceae bacterium]|nr:hypothetical protein [Sulfurimonadaceae bacterium]